MSPPVKKPKGKRPRDSNQSPAEPETKPSPSKKERLIDTPANPNELQATQNPTKSSTKTEPGKKHVSFPQTSPQNILDTPKTPRTPANAEQLGLGPDAPKQL